MATEPIQPDDGTITPGGADGSNPFGIGANDDSSSRRSGSTWGRGKRDSGTTGGWGFRRDSSTSGTGTGTGTRKEPRVQPAKKNPRVKKGKGIILPWEWVAPALQNATAYLAKRFRPVLMSDGTLLWAIDKEEAATLAKAVVPLGKYIPIDLPEGSSELAKELKPVIDALALIVGQRLAVEQLIAAANRPPPPSNNGTTTATQPMQQYEVPRQQAEPVTVTNSGSLGYDVSKDRRGTIGS